MLDRVTITGADDNTDPMQLVKLSQRYPFVEFGILISGHEASDRFPSREWIQDLAVHKVSYLPEMKVSAHLCGQPMRDAYLGHWDHFLYYLTDPNRVRLFNRIQLNSHGVLQACDELAMGAGISVMLVNGYDIIFQYDWVNTMAFEACRELWSAPTQGKPNTTRVHALFDLSHGQGKLPDKWPTSLLHTYCGYAGGLSPDNVAEELAKINQAAIHFGDVPYWIDAETHLRTDISNGGDISRASILDLNKVKRFLRAVEPFTKPK